MAAATISTNTENSPQPRSIQLLIAGEVFDRKRLQNPLQAAAFQHALFTARTRFGHALCQCRRSPLKLQIRQRDGKFHLAVWPEEGHLHDSDCSYFREEEQLSPVEEIKGSVKEQADGTRAISLSFAFDRKSTSQDSARLESKSSSDTPQAVELASLRNLSNLIWGEANLTRWHPTWSRDWGRSRYELMQAAQRLIVEGETLASRLFIPRPYRENIKAELNREWDRFVGTLARGPGVELRSGLVIAPVRRITDLDGGSSIVHLRHMLSPIGLSENTYDFLSKNNRTALRRIIANEEARNSTKALPEGWIETRHPEVIAFLQVEANARGGLWARGAWIMATHPTAFIPANSADEVLLVDALIEGKYSFTRILSTERPMLRTTPDWILRHVADHHGVSVPKAALEILNNGNGPEFLLKRADLADSLAKSGVPTWTWTPQGRQIDHVVPTLPPRDDLIKEQVHHALDQMNQEKTVIFAYGSGRLSHNLVNGEFR